MDDMINELFYGNLDLSLMELKRGSDYNKKRSQVMTILDDLEGQISERSIQSLRDALNELDLLTSHAYFTIGFRWGARMLLSIFDDDESLFSTLK